MKRLSDNQTSMFPSTDNSFNMDYNNKKMRIEPNLNKPSKVVHFRGIPSDTTDPEIVQLGLPFGKMVNLVLCKKKNQALLEMEELSTAQDLVNYYTDKPLIIRDRTVYVQFSNYDHLKTENTQSMQALQMAEQLVGYTDESKTILRVIIDNMIYPITIDILKLIFSKYGNVLRIVTYNKNNMFQALIQYSDAVSAKSGLLGLNGQNIYNGCCTLRIDFSHLQNLQVKYNNDRSWDYTNPNLPMGQNSSAADAGALEPAGDGILGSYSGTLAGLGLGGFGGLGKSGGLIGNGTSNGSGFPNLGSLGLMVPGSNSASSLLGGPHMGSTNSVLIVSNLNEEKVTPDYLFTLFGMYGMVTRVKIMYNKKDNALVQFTDPFLAQNAIACLDKLKWYGKVIKVSVSKHNVIQLPKEGQSDESLTKDYSNSKLHRHTNPASKNYGSINPPSATLHVTNMPFSMSESELKDLFSKAGNVVTVKFLEKERKMALVQMASVEDGVAGLVEMHNYQLPGPFNLRVSFTKSTI